jgi:glycosyltransferase involved in cell wall biosynthesis
MRPTVSFIIPAHDEEAIIATCVDAVHTAAQALHVPYEVIVVDDQSTDQTAVVARAAGSRVVRITRRHIAAARNSGAAAARSNAFIFVDADTIVNAAVVRAALEALRAGAMGGGSQVRFDEPVPRWARTMLRAFLWVYTRLRLAGGCFVFCSRVAFDAVGGFDETMFAAEEVRMSRALGRHGRFVILSESVLTSSRKLRTHSAREIGLTLLRIPFLWPWMVRSRRRLELWYGPRREDPAHTG